jgi:hypothetical protein
MRQSREPVGFSGSPQGRRLKMKSLSTGAALLKVASLTNLKRCTRQAIATLIAVALLNLIATAGYAKPKPGPDVTAAAIIGTLVVNGIVTVNGSPAVSGQTLFTGSGITTSAESESTLALQNQARLKLERETSLRIEFSKAGLSAALDVGAMRALIPTSVRVGISTPDAVITPDPNQAAAFSVLVEACSTTLIVETGHVEIRSGDKVTSILSGESFSTGGGPQAPSGSHSLSGRKKAGLMIGIGGAVAILLLALRGEEQTNEQPGGGCVIILSPTSGGGGCQ